MIFSFKYQTQQNPKMTDIKSDEDEVLVKIFFIPFLISYFFCKKLTCKRQKTKKIAIDSDAEDDFSNLLAKPTKQEKEPLERKDYIHNSAKKSSKPISTKEKTTNSLENNNPLGENVVLKEEKNVSNGEKEHLAKEKDHKEHISKEKEHISKEKDSHQKEKDHSMKEKTISKEKDHLNKEKEGNLHKEKENHEKEKNKTISHVKNNEPIKTGESKEKTKVKLENKTPMKTKNSPKPKKFREPDSDNSLFDPGTSSDEDRRKIKSNKIYVFFKKSYHFSFKSTFFFSKSLKVFSTFNFFRFFFSIFYNFSSIFSTFFNFLQFSTLFFYFFQLFSIFSLF